MFKKYRFYLFLFGFPLIANIAVFLWVYSLGGDISLPVQIPLYLIISLLPWFFIKIDLWKKVIFFFLLFVFNCLLNFVIIFSTMYLPGSKEHNYIMYQVCLPKMRETYGIGENQLFPETDVVDKKGFAKWWYQHSECEENVRKGKGPVWSENPPGFIPVKKIY